ncbi:MAG: DUF4335 domain-containing protein [Cyanothece sp. SIO2G6]|nr:DUF4335 domain-containing protein [Cyanothece sp. SIO2G6]
MTIQRQYMLANCKLVLEGWEDAPDPSAAPSPRPMLSIITHVECHFSGVEKPLTGGQELLTNLVHTVSRYVQGMLSGIEHPIPAATQTTARVQMQALEGDRHQLTVNQAGSETDPGRYQVDLSTNQLFDLVEVVDQLVADGQTLPQLSVDLSPVPKRFVAVQEPVTEKLLPATVGVSSLAVAAIALFLIPVPEVERPEIDPRPPLEEQAPDSSSSGFGPEGFEPGLEDVPEGANDPEEDDADEGDADKGDADEGDADEGTAARSGGGDTPASDSDNSNVDDLDTLDTDSPNSETDVDNLDNLNADRPNSEAAVDFESEVTSDDPDVTAIDIPDFAEELDSPTNLPDTDEVDDLLRSAQPIADPDQLTDLTRLLRDRIDRAWDRPEPITQNFVYRVGVSETGELIGFTPVNDQGFTDSVDNPLNQLDTAPISVGDAERPVGQFRVVFRTTGVVEVSPWYGRLSD